MPDRAETLLEMAVRHVAEARRIVEEQRRRIASARQEGNATLDLEQALQMFESTLRIFEDDERRIREYTGKASGKV